MVNLRKNVLHVSIMAAILVGMSGCSALKETMASQVEVPTLEKQVNRVAVGMDIVRENNIMAVKTKISGDTSWPKLIASDLNATQEKALAEILRKDAYYATVKFTEPFQRKMLGGSALMNNLNGMAGFDVGALAGAVSDPISPLMYRAAQKAQVLYGDDPKNWPDLFSFDGGLKNFLEFKSGNLKMVEAGTTDVYDTLSQALISLTPTNFQKDLTAAKDDLDKAQEKVAELEGEKSELKGELEKKTANKNEINKKIDAIDEKLKPLNAAADEKEKIYFTLLESAITALKSDIKLSDEQIKLARNVNIVSKEIESGSKEAYSAFGVAVLSVGAQPILQNFPKELTSLTVSLTSAQQRFPQYADQIKTRIERLTKNAIYFLPNLGMGTYYAHKQSSLAGKYEDISGVIVDAADAKEKADKKAAEEAQKAAAEAKKAQQPKE
jgi:hypothetical protein